MSGQPQNYDTSNSPEVVPGRRIARFFGVPDPVRKGELSVEQIRAIASVLPAVLTEIALPAGGSYAARSWQGGGATLTLEAEIQKAKSPERAEALAKWLGGATGYQAAMTAGIEESQFSNWVHHSARVLIGNETVYSALLQASEIVLEQPGSPTPA